jgi:hypothetical protein
MPYGRLGANTQVFQASGEATEQSPVPTEFTSSNMPVTSRITSQLSIPPEFNGNIKKMPIVQRAQRTKGMVYLYNRGAHAMPIHPLGADGVPLPYTSKYNPNDMGPIRNCGFNHALFEAGYPGFNLALSFKVQTINKEPGRLTSPGYAMRMRGPKSQYAATQKTPSQTRASGRRLSS